jgi:alcohol dehydrogenase, propanol-preferring
MHVPCQFAAHPRGEVNTQTGTMRAMILEAPHQPLRSMQLAIPRPGPGQVLLRVRACGVCRTDLHVVDGELPHPKLPLIPGHEIVGAVAECGEGPARFSVGDRVGVPWLGFACGKCRYCTTGRENLCDYARFTGYQLDGGYAEYVLADQRFAFPLPAEYADTEAAPLLCAGLIGYRSLVLAGDAKRLGLYGFGAAAHIIAQVARHQGREVFAFTKIACRRRNWTPPSFSPRLAAWFPRRCGPWLRAERWCARGFT